MASTATVPKNPHAVILLGGDRWDSWTNKQLIKSVRVELATDQASEATLTVFDPRFEFINRYTTSGGVPWLVCKFYLGFGRELGEPVFTGLLAEVGRNDTDTTFRCYDMGYKMRQERKTEYHNNQHDLKIIEKLARRNGLDFEGPDKAVNLERHRSNIQASRNDWEHGKHRARQAGLVLFVRQNKLYAKEPATIREPILSLVYRKDFWLLHGFDITYKVPENQLGRPKQTEYRGRQKGGRRLTGKSDTHPRGTKPVQVTESLAIHNKAYANRRAKAHKELQRDPAFQGTIRSISPLPLVRPDVRDTIALLELGELFSGAYLCDKATHEFQAPDTFHAEYSLYRDIDV